MKSREQMISFCRESLALPESLSLELLPLAGRGSQRDFFRLKWENQGSAILVHYDSKRLENSYYADIAVFLAEIGVPAPHVVRHDSPSCLILLEDLGDEDLWSLRNTPWETRGLLYRKVLSALRRLHSFPEKDFPTGRIRLMEGFGPDLYLWEREYFKEHFVRNFCGIDLVVSFRRELEAELSALAGRLSGAPRCLVHRDLQSQNVMIRGGEPFLIDFQGMRFGTSFYDLGSLLCDPYVVFSEAERDGLLSFSHGLSEENPPWPSFQNSFWEASAQRLMQALGAFGFLGLQKKLSAFLEHIPAGLRNLQRAASRADSLPRLLEVSLTCQEALAKRKEEGRP